MDIRSALLTSEEITARANAIGVPLGRLAVEAGFASSTPYRWSSGGSNSRTLRAIQKTLEAKERALLLSLLKLHPEVLEDAA